MSRTYAQAQEQMDDIVVKAGVLLELDYIIPFERLYKLEEFMLFQHGIKKQLKS